MASWCNIISVQRWQSGSCFLPRIISSFKVSSWLSSCIYAPSYPSSLLGCQAIILIMPAGRTKRKVWTLQLPLKNGMSSSGAFAELWLWHNLIVAFRVAEYGRCFWWPSNPWTPPSPWMHSSSPQGLHWCYAWGRRLQQWSKQRLGWRMQSAEHEDDWPWATSRS